MVSVAGGYGDVHMVCFDGLRLRFPGGRRLRRRAVERCRQSLAGADPDRVGARRHQHHDRACRHDRRCAHKLRRRPGQARPCRRYRRMRRSMPAACRASPAARWRSFPTTSISSAGARAGRSRSPTTATISTGWSASARRTAPARCKGLLGSNSGRATDFQLPDGTVLLPAERCRDSRRLRRCLARGAGRFALGRQLARNNGARPGDLRRTGPGQRRSTISACRFRMRILNTLAISWRLRYSTLPSTPDPRSPRCC